MHETVAIDVAYVARLARLRLSDADVATFQQQLEQVVEYVRQIEDLDLDGVEPTAHGQPIVNVFRDDRVRESLPRDAVLANAPAADGAHVLVPRIVE